MSSMAEIRFQVTWHMPSLFLRCPGRREGLNVAPKKPLWQSVLYTSCPLETELPS